MCCDLRVSTDVLLFGTPRRSPGSRIGTATEVNVGYREVCRTESEHFVVGIAGDAARSDPGCDQHDQGYERQLRWAGGPEVDWVALGGRLSAPLGACRALSCRPSFVQLAR
jgi:hypothetical protein